MVTSNTNWLEQAKNLLNTTQNQVELWQTYAKGLQKLAHLWAESLEQSLAITNNALVSDRLTLTELTDLYWNLYEKTFGNIPQSLTLGYSKEFHQQLRNNFDAWIKFSRTNTDYQIMLIEVWMKASEQLIREIVSLEEKGEKIRNWQQIIGIWSSIFDQMFSEKFHSNGAVEIQGEFLNAAMAYKLQQQQMIELFLKMYGLPTRSEVDEIHRSIYELRKEIKSLRKDLINS